MDYQSKENELEVFTFSYEDLNISGWKLQVCGDAMGNDNISAYIVSCMVSSEIVKGFENSFGITFSDYHPISKTNDIRGKESDLSRTISDLYHRYFTEITAREIAHDIANPLTTIRVNTDFLQSLDYSTDNDTVIRESLKSIKSQLTRITDVIQEIRHQRLEGLDEEIDYYEFLNYLDRLSINNRHLLNIYVSKSIDEERISFEKILILQLIAEISSNYETILLISEMNNLSLYLCFHDFRIPEHVNFLELANYDHSDVNYYLLEKFLYKYNYDMETSKSQNFNMLHLTQ